MPMLQWLGDFLRRRQEMVRAIQWCFVVLYVLLLAAPVVIRHPLVVYGITLDGARLAEAVFWGIWWPGAILATLLFGQFWCGLLCPDGTMTEFLSRHGRAAKIPLKLRWPGWPPLAFVVITLLWYLADARSSRTGTLALLGGFSLVAWSIGYWFAPGRRLWCRYLCPAATVFSLLSRGAVVHFRVDRKRWDAAPRSLPKFVDCPQLLDVRRLEGNAKCTLCCRCSGHRNAVALAPRPPGAEIGALREQDATPLDAFVVCFVLIGLCYAITRESLALIDVVGNMVTLGGSVASALWLGALGQARRAMLMSYTLIPLAGITMFVGALEYTHEIFAQCGIMLPDLAPFRIALVVSGTLWTVFVGIATTIKLAARPGSRAAALLGQLVAASLLAAAYIRY